MHDIVLGWFTVVYAGCVCYVMFLMSYDDMILFLIVYNQSLTKIQQCMQGFFLELQEKFNFYQVPTSTNTILVF